MEIVFPFFSASVGTLNRQDGDKNVFLHMKKPKEVSNLSKSSKLNVLLDKLGTLTDPLTHTSLSDSISALRYDGQPSQNPSVDILL